MKKEFITLFALLLFSSKFMSSQQAKIDSLNQILLKSTAEDKVKTLNQLAYLYKFSQPESAIETGEKALNLAKQINNLLGIIESNLLLGEIYLSTTEMDKVFSFASKGLELSNQLSNNYQKSRGLLLMSKYYLFIGDAEKSIDYNTKALSIAEKYSYSDLTGSCYSFFGIIYEQLGNYNLAVENYYKSLQIAEENNNQRGTQNSLFNIGQVLILNQKYDEALVYYNKALTLSEILEDDTGILFYYHMLGVWHQKQDQYTQALKMNEIALKLAKKLNDTLGIAILLGNTATLYRDMGEPEKTLSLLFQALELKLSLQKDPSHTYNDIAETYFLIDNPDKALFYANKAIESATQNNNLNQLKYANYLLSHYYLLKKDFENAYNSYVEYTFLKDSIFNIDKSTAIETIRVQYETDKKEQQIQSLNQQHKAEKFRRNALAGFSGFILLIGILLVSSQRSKSRKNRLLYEKGQEVEKTKSRFFANITHEFRTPLTLILGPIEILKTKITSKDALSQLEVMEKNSNRLLDLINQLLDLSKLESGKMKLQTVQEDILMLIRRISGLFESVAEIKKIKLSIKNRLNNTITYIDPDKIEKVFVNLISNALKFTPDRGTISISLEEIKITKKPFPRYIQIKIKDSGKGIPPDDLEHIFNQYYQSNNTQDSEYAGTGIGLALTKELVELHGGTIIVSSEMGVGTEFTVTLLAEAKTVAMDWTNQKKLLHNKSKIYKSQNRPVKKDITVESAPSEKKPLLLLIEDNAEVRDYVKNIVSSHYKIEVAKDGNQGFEKALGLIPDLVISDVMMPGMNGFELCEKMKSDEKTSHIPVILLTARAAVEDKIEGLERKADDYLAKPFVPKELLTRISNLIENRHHMREKFSKEFVFKPGDVEVSSVDDLFLEKLKSNVETNLENEQLGVDDLAGLLNMSRSQLHRKVKALTNLAPNEFIRNYRLVRSMELIKKNAGTTAEIAFNVGFSSPSYFTRCFREHFGFPPTELSKNIS
ncbi:MAG: tetratricopeptide repeat protein [Bacteroidales bacterium]|nr:tetratricopeptide repeat protein [Bacteroidales bacterium]